MVSIARSRVMTQIALIASSLLALFVVAVIFAWSFQERIAFQPPRPPYPDDAGIHRVGYSASDGQRLFAYLIGNQQAPRGILLAFHGNADLAVRQVEWANEAVRRTGMTVMLAEYRGYMGLAGRPTYAGSKLDSEAAYLFMRRSIGVPPEKIAFFGHSLGSAIAVELAVSHPPAALLLESPFTSARDMAELIIRWTPGVIWSIVSRLHFDTGAKVAQLDIPVSVVHGGSDRLIPLWMGSHVFAAARTQGRWLLVPDALHNDVRIKGGEGYWRWVVEALDPIITSFK